MDCQQTRRVNWDENNLPTSLYCEPVWHTDLDFRCTCLRNAHLEIFIVPHKASLTPTLPWQIQTHICLRPWRFRSWRSTSWSMVTQILPLHDVTCRFPLLSTFSGWCSKPSYGHQDELSSSQTRGGSAKPRGKLSNPWIRPKSIATALVEPWNWENYRVDMRKWRKARVQQTILAGSQTKNRNVNFIKSALASIEVTVVN